MKTRYTPFCKWTT